MVIQRKGAEMRAREISCGNQDCCDGYNNKNVIRNINQKAKQKNSYCAKPAEITKLNKRNLNDPLIET